MTRDEDISEEQSVLGLDVSASQACDQYSTATELSGRIDEVTALLQQAETKARELLRTAREQHLSFGFMYNYVDEDIAQVRGRLRHMRLIAEHR